MNTENTIVGIDLGTTNSCIGIYKDGHVEIIINKQGNRTTPSWVAFTDTERLIGEAAKNQYGINAENTIYDSKRLIGKLFNDETIQSDLKHWPFKIKSDKNNKPLICVKYKNEEKEFTPEEISSMILLCMKEAAESYLGYLIKRAVVTVPAYFNDAQRRATIDAGIIAGLKIERIINEPTAAAMAYELDKKCNIDRIVLIFDLGGGTLDVSLLYLDNGVCTVIATNGKNHLGGQDLDIILLNYCLSEFAKHNKDCNIETINKKTMSRLKTACEKAKKELSSILQTTIEIPSLYNGNDLFITISRAKFESLCINEFNKCLECIEQVLHDAKMSKDKITDIVLIGGSTRIPYIKNMLKNYFNGKEPKQDINPDEAVAYGAAIQGAILSQVNDDKIKSMVLVDVIPLSLGIETAGGQMTKILNRNNNIPCSKEQVFSTYSDNQPCVTIKIYEGEREFTKYNNLLGTFELTNIPPMPRGIPKINVKFEIDANGILKIQATEESTGKSNNIIIKNDKNRFTTEELNKFIENANKFSEEDKYNKECLEHKNNIENYVYYVRNSINLEEFKKNINEENYKKINDIINETIIWIENNPNLSSLEYKQKQKEIENKIVPIFMKAYNKI